MPEIDKDKVAIGGTIGLGTAGLLTHLGLKAVDQAKAVHKQHQRYEARVFDILKNTTVGQLNQRQKKALEFFGIDIKDIDPNTKLSKLETGKVRADGEAETLVEMLQGDKGYKAKVNKNDLNALRRQAAMGEFIVPVEQQIVKQAKAQTGYKKNTARAVSEQLHEGGAAPRIGDVKPQLQDPFKTIEEGQPLTYEPGRNMSWVNPSGMMGLRQGAAGETQPTSSLITNPSFLFPGRQTTATQVRGRLPSDHPSVRRAPVNPEQAPATPPPGQEIVPPQRPGIPAAESSNWTGSETPAQRIAEYDEALRQRRKANWLYVPGEGVGAKAKNIGRNMVRGAINAPVASKAFAAATLAAGIGGTVWSKKDAVGRADEIQSAVQPQTQGQNKAKQTPNNTAPEPQWQEGWHKDAVNGIRRWPMFRGYSDDQITKYMTRHQGETKYSGSAQLWLQYHGQ